LFYLHVRSKRKTLNLYTQALSSYCFFVVRHVGKARLDKVERVESSQVEFGPIQSGPKNWHTFYAL